MLPLLHSQRRTQPKAHRVAISLAKDLIDQGLSRLKLYCAEINLSELGLRLQPSLSRVSAAGEVLESSNTLFHVALTEIEFRQSDAVAEGFWTSIASGYEFLSCSRRAFRHAQITHDIQSRFYVGRIGRGQDLQLFLRVGWPLLIDVMLHKRSAERNFLRIQFDQLSQYGLDLFGVSHLLKHLELEQLDPDIVHIRSVLTIENCQCTISIPARKLISGNHDRGFDVVHILSQRRIRLANNPFVVIELKKNQRFQPLSIRVLIIQLDGRVD